jgi:excisionase family DNA binding protein
MPIESPTKQLLSVADVCEVLDVSRTTLYRLKSSGKLPRCIKLGRSVKYRRDEIEAWIAAGCPPRSKWSWGG